MRKTCSKCNEEKPIEHFATRADTGKQRSHCRSCVNASNLLRYHSKPSTKEAHRRASRKHQLKKYNLTEEDYLRMYDEQQGQCAICNKDIEITSENRYLSACVDHCHTTKAVRGLLCWDCNVGLGKFHDDTDFLEAAIDYLKKEHKYGTCD